MERFVRMLVGGGVALVGGLWVVSALETWSVPWLAGAALVLFGAGGLAGGIWTQVDSAPA